MNSKNELLTIYWKDSRVHILDQRLLPHRVEYLACSSCSEVVEAIREMAVRGAPAIGIAAAFGMAVAACEGAARGFDRARLQSHLAEASKELLQSRPTAVNLTWALERIGRWLSGNKDLEPRDLAAGVLREAENIYNEDLKNNRLIGKNGTALIPDGASILTHCNAGALATGGYGTALGVVRAAVEEGKDVCVYIDETRPLLQGARLSAFEMIHEQIPTTLIIDSCAGYLMKQGKIDLVVVGADCIAGNGDVANKIGTYSLAVMAACHNIPFYVAAPLSTINLALPGGDEIIIEERSPEEVTFLGDRAVAPDEINVYNPAFDVTPALLIKALITEKGVVYAPNQEKLYKLFEKV